VLYEVDCVVEGVVVVVVLLLLCLEVVFRIYLRVTQTVSPCAARMLQTAFDSCFGETNYQHMTYSYMGGLSFS
jgi:hypothetical protein